MPSYLEGFDREKGGRLAGLLGTEFTNQLGRARTERNRIEQAFMRFLDPSFGEEYVTRGAERIAADVLRPGGVVTEGIRGARGRAIASGFGTQGGDLSRQEANIISEGLRSSIGSHIGAALPGMYEGAAGRAAGAYQLSAEQIQNLIESMYTGLAGAESLALAKDKGLLGLGLGPF